MGNKRAHPPAPSATQVRREQSADLEAEEEEADQQRGNEVELDEVSQAFRAGWPSCVPKLCPSWATV